MAEQDLSLRELIEKRKVIICCGAGGVGKTTTSASIAVAAARSGRRVLVLTIDPSKRLAEALGVSANLSAPVAVSEACAAQAEIQAPGSLHAWMLDPSIIAEQAVRKLARDPAELQRILSNRLYQAVSQMLAGMQEYTAMKALHRFLRDDHYDLVVLDTPPSRHALDFLESPGRVAEFLEGRVFKLFLPTEAGPSGFLKRAASSLVHKVLSSVFGEEFAGDISVFFGSFGGMLRSLNQDLAAVREMLRDPQLAAFLLVTSSGLTALQEAFYFEQKTREMGLPFRGFVLNRTWAAEQGRPMPGELTLPEFAEAQQARDKLTELAQVERARAERDQGLLAQLHEKSGPGAFAIALPWISQGEEEGIGMLVKLAGALMGESQRA